MPLPKIKLTPETALSLAANHGEKMLAVIAILCSLPLAWGGVNALRTQMLDQEKSPARIINAADKAENLFRRAIDQEQQAALRRKLQGPRVDAVAAIEAWQVAEVDKPTTGIGLNRPLLGDIKKRESPEVFPIEQLRALPGMAAIARRQQDQPFVGMPDPNASIDPSGMQESIPTVQSPPATQLPYVMLTGLIPAKKQAEEFRSLYATASFTDPQRDSPRWSDYTVERQEVGAAGEGAWMKIDLRKTVQRWGQTWGGAATETLPAELMLSSAENPRDPATMPIGFFGPLPQLAERPSLGGIGGGLTDMGGSGLPGTASWGLSGLHPWVIAEMEKLMEQRAAAAEQQGAMPGLSFADGGMPSGSGMDAGPGFSAFGGDGFSGEMDMEGSFDDPLGGQGGLLNPNEYRLFRFLDTDVEPGKSYRYRVTIRLWNPNVNLPIRYLEKPELAEAVTLAAEAVAINRTVSGGPIRVPGSSQVLARLLSRDDKKQAGLGGSDNEALVLDANPDSNNFELHSAEIKLGQPISIEKGARRIKLGNRRIAVPEHAVETDLTVLGVVGEQELDDKKRITRGFMPPPPFTLLLVDSAGNIHQVTPGDSAETVKKYLPTLPGYMPPQATGAMTEPGF